MILKSSIEAVDSSIFSDNFRKPLYDSYCFSRISGSIVKLLTGDNSKYNTLPEDIFAGFESRYERVIFVFTDAFGWKFFEQFHEQSHLLQRFSEEGLVAKLTSQFPSTTAAHVTGFNTGMTPSETGIYEWFIYEPLVDDIISPIPFSLQRESGRENLHSLGIKPDEILPTTNIHQFLTKQGIGSYYYGDRHYTPSSYCNAIYTGTTEIIPFPSFKAGVSTLLERIPKAKGLHYIYADQFDKYMHKYGPDSEQAGEVGTEILREVERLATGAPKKTLLMMSADHGMMEISPETTIYLDEEIPELKKHILHNANGDELAPAGSARDLFLHVKKDSVSHVVNTINKRFGDKLIAYDTQSLIEQELFGTGAPSKRFLERVADVTVLTHDKQSVWWSANGAMRNKFFGQHGGLAQEEMEIPLLLLEID